MSNGKRSFFKRLMGVEREEEHGHDNYGYYQNEEPSYPPASSNNSYSEENYSPQPESVPYEGENSITPTYASSPEQTSRITPNQIPVQNHDQEEGSWVADQEGQLTIDVYQTDMDIVIKSTIAGVKPEDLDIQINNDMVTIRGERRKEDEIRDEDYYYQECYWGAFSRSIILPVDVEANKSEAIMKNGILTIKLPKAETAKARKIQVRGY